MMRVVDKSGINFLIATLYDTETEVEEKVIYEDGDYPYGESPFLSRKYTLAQLDEISKTPIDKDARHAWLKKHGIISVSDTVEVIKGRKLPIGTRGTVVNMWDFTDRFGRTQTNYAKLDSGVSISIENLKIV